MSENVELQQLVDEEFEEEYTIPDSRPCCHCPYLGLILATLSSLFFSLCSVIVKWMTDVHPMALAAYRYLGVLLPAIPIIIYREEIVFPKGKRIMLLLRSFTEQEFPLASIYYDPSTKYAFRMTSIKNMLVNTNTYSTRNNVKTKIVRRIGFRSNGCTCQNFLNCGCCLGINMNLLNFNNEGCLNFTYVPDDFALQMGVFMNNNKIYSNTFSAKNPPPLCIPLPIPYIPIQVEACAKLYDIYTAGTNLHMCLDFETRIQRATVLVLHFDCMRMGLNGVALLKPEDGSGLNPTIENEDEEIEVYDEVTEIKYKN